MPKDTVHAAMTPKTADGITPPTPRKTGKKKKRSGKPAPFVRVTTWMGAQTGEHDRHVSEELLPHLRRIGAQEARVVRIDVEQWALVTRWKSWNEMTGSLGRKLLTDEEIAVRFPDSRFVNSLTGKRAERWLAVIDGTHPEDPSVVSMPEVIAP